MKAFALWCAMGVMLLIVGGSAIACAMLSVVFEFVGRTIIGGLGDLLMKIAQDGLKLLQATMRR